MNRAARFLVAGPAVGGVRSFADSRRFVHGGSAYRAIAEELLSPDGHVTHLDWDPDVAIERRIDSLHASLPGADALITMPWLFAGERESVLDTAQLDASPDLRVVAGTNDYRFGWVDFDAAVAHHVAIIDTSRSMTPTVAEFGVAITLALLREIPGALDVVRSGGWLTGLHEVDHVFRDLASCRLGLAGYGSINRHYRRFIQPFGTEVRAFDPFVDQEALAADAVTAVDSLVELAELSDILVVAIPPTPSTLGVIDRNVIDALAPGSLLVLLSRMAVVDQDALWRRARAREIAIAVDVFDPEPPPEDAWFRRAPNVLPTPHIAGNVRFAHERCFREACEDALRVVREEPPMYEVNGRDKRLYEGTLEPTDLDAMQRKSSGVAAPAAG